MLKNKTWLFILTGLFLFSFACADEIVLPNPIGPGNFQELLDAITSFLFTIGIVGLPLMIMISAFYLVTSGGSPEKVKTGKNILIYAIIGLFIILLSRAIVAVMQGFFTI